MFSHPVSFVGYAITIGGWVWLAFGVSSGTEVLGRQIVNVHSIAIAQSIVALGYAISIAGIVAAGAERLLESKGRRETVGDDEPSATGVLDPEARRRLAERMGYKIRD